MTEDCGCGGDCACSHDPAPGNGSDHGAHDDDPADGPPDPQLDPTKSPGFGETPEGLAEIDVGRDITLGEATPEELTASDTTPVEGSPVTELLADLSDGNHVDRRRAALALADANADDRDTREAIETSLARAARPAEDDDARQFAVEALGDLGGETAAAVARILAVGPDPDPDPWVRAEAVVALDGLDRAKHAETIETAFDDEHHAVRRNAMISLFKLRGEDSLSILLDGADDDSERVREWAVHMLGGVDDDRAREALERTVRTADSEVVRATAARALSIDPDRFRRNFTGALDRGPVTLPGEDLLNRQPDL